jgi:general L-amino acid transport system substrate-binding protein
LLAHSITALIALALFSCVAAHAADAPSTLSRLRASGVLRCGIDVAQAEYSTSDDHGNRSAFDADLCKAVAVAALGKDARIQTINFPDDQAAMQALIKGEVDLLPTLTDDFSHTAKTHLRFTRPVLWDGISFLVPDQSKATHATQLSGKKICFLAETHVEESVRAWFAREHLSFVPFPFQEEGEMQAAFATGNCAALSGEATRLAETRIALAQRGMHLRLLPERISQEPLAAAVRDDDSQWAALVQWVMEALVQAEEIGITQANVQAMQKQASNNPTLRFLLGASHEVGAALGLDNSWVAHVIAATGNYGEIYQRDLGGGSPMKLSRNENNLRRRSGLMTSLPFK